jgi:hypothetical protein
MEHPLKVFKNGELVLSCGSVEEAVWHVSAETGIEYDTVWDRTEHGPMVIDGGVVWFIETK